MPKSKAYSGMINDAGADVYVRNVMKAMPIEFTESSEQAKIPSSDPSNATKGMSPEEFTGEANAAATFADGGALTMRLRTDNDWNKLGGYMLGVSYTIT